MQPRHRAEAGFAVAGLLLVGILGLDVGRFGFQDWMTSGLVQGLGLLVAAVGAAGLRGGHGHGRPALAAGLLILLVGQVMDLGFTLAWEGRTALYMVGSFVMVAGAAQAAWYAALAAARTDAAGAGMGVALGIATCAAGHALGFLQSLLLSPGLAELLRVGVVVGLLLAASGVRAGLDPRSVRTAQAA